MRLTTKGRYAVTSMLHLALHQGGGPIALAGISTDQNISLSYLEQLFARLRRRKLVKSVRGPGGGYLLGKPAEHISVAEVIEAVNEHTDATRCLGKGDCQQGEICLTHHLWMDLSGQVSQFLANISLADLAAGNRGQPNSPEAHTELTATANQIQPLAVSSAALQPG